MRRHALTSLHAVTYFIITVWYFIIDFWFIIIVFVSIL